ncbi:MAG: hypothetical protein ACYTGV_18625, partial [Planctomycetota bacterium]
MTEQMARILLRARSTWQLTETLRLFVRWGAPVVGALIVLCVLDNLLHLPGWARLAVGAAWLLATAGTFVAVALPALTRRRSHEATARMMEERLGVKDNVLINAL